MTTATKEREARDRGEVAVRHTVGQIMCLVGPYIPQRCQEEVMRLLYDRLLEAGVEFTTNNMRKEYEQWKRITLEVKK